MPIDRLSDAITWLRMLLITENSINEPNNLINNNWFMPVIDRLRQSLKRKPCQLVGSLVGWHFFDQCHRTIPMDKSWRPDDHFGEFCAIFLWKQHICECVDCSLFLPKSKKTQQNMTSFHHQGPNQRLHDIWVPRRWKNESTIIRISGNFYSIASNRIWSK